MGASSIWFRWYPPKQRRKKEGKLLLPSGHPLRPKTQSYLSVPDCFNAWGRGGKISNSAWFTGIWDKGRSATNRRWREEKEVTWGWRRNPSYTYDIMTNQSLSSSLGARRDMSLKEAAFLMYGSPYHSIIGTGARLRKICAQLSLMDIWKWRVRVRGAPQDKMENGSRSGREQ